MPSDVLTLPETARLPWTAWVELLSVRHLLWSAYSLAVPGLPAQLSGLRVLHLTDLHMTRRWMPVYDRLLARVADNPPDLILISGDFVEHQFDPVPALPNVRKLLGGLTARLGLYGTLGNHDGDILPPLLGDVPVRLLHNETVTLHNGDAAVEIFGGYGIERADLSPRVVDALGPRPPGTLRLGMIHYPSQYLELASAGFDVLFAGHTHGGQVCLPGGWPLLTHDVLPRRMARGVHRVGETWLVVGRGIGFSSYPVRTFCPAEAIEVTLVSSAG